MTRANNKDKQAAVDTSKGKSGSSSAEVVWGGFINLRFTDAQKESFREWFAENNAIVSDKLAELLCDGYKVSLNYNSDNDTFSCSLIGLLLRTSEKRYATTAYAPDWWQAVAALVYKHCVIAEGNWDDFKPSKANFDKLG